MDFFEWWNTIFKCYDSLYDLTIFLVSKMWSLKFYFLDKNRSEKQWAHSPAKEQNNSPPLSFQGWTPQPLVLGELQLLKWETARS